MELTVERLDNRLMAGTEQVWIEQDQARRLRTGKRESLFLADADQADDAGIGGAGGGKKRLTIGYLNATKPLLGEQRALTGFVRPDRGEGGWSGTISTRGTLRREQNAGIDQRVQWTCGEFLVLLNRGLVDRDGPTFAADVLASGIDAAEVLCVCGVDQFCFAQRRLLAGGFASNGCPG